jgi:protein-L-isoaspartate(D-aspartate) O-methyltransferase
LATDVTTPVPTTADLRRRLVDELTTEGAITTDAVASAVLTVPREAFAPPGTDPADVYAAHGVLITKRGSDGQAMSSISAPWLSLSTPVVLRT